MIIGVDSRLSFETGAYRDQVYEMPYRDEFAPRKAYFLVYDPAMDAILVYGGIACDSVEELYADATWRLTPTLDARGFILVKRELEVADPNYFFPAPVFVPSINTTLVIGQPKPYNSIFRVARRTHGELLCDNPEVVSKDFNEIAGYVSLAVSILLLIYRYVMRIADAC